jgi:hypothetical protein
VRYKLRANKVDQSLKGAVEEGGKRYGNTGENGISSITFFNGRVIRLSNLNIKALDVLYKSINAFITLKNYLQHHI